MNDKIRSIDHKEKCVHKVGAYALEQILSMTMMNAIISSQLNPGQTRKLKTSSANTSVDFTFFLDTSAATSLFPFDMILQFLVLKLPST